MPPAAPPLHPSDKLAFSLCASAHPICAKIQQIVQRVIKRFNNIAVAEAEPCPGADSLRLLKYHRNEYCGMLGEILASGWEDSGDALRHGAISLGKTLFKEPEGSYALAAVEPNDGAGVTRLCGIEDRVLGLSPSEYADFFEAYRHADIVLLRRNLVPVE